MSTLSVNNVSEVGGAPVITSGVLDSGSLPTGTVLQVVSTTKTDTFSTTSNTPVDITGANVTITPSSTSNKVYVTFTTPIGSSIGDVKAIQLLRDATVIGGGTAAGSRLSAISAVETVNAAGRYQISGFFLDSPNTTSSVTYSLKTWSDVSGRVTYIGRNNNDSDNSQPANTRTPLTITVMEIAG